MVIPYLDLNDSAHLEMLSRLHEIGQRLDQLESSIAAIRDTQREQLRESVARHERTPSWLTIMAVAVIGYLFGQRGKEKP